MKQILHIAVIAAAVAGMVAPAAADTNNLNWTWDRDGGTGGLVRARAVAPETVSANDTGTAIYVGGYYDSDTFDFLIVKDTTPGEPVGDDYIIVDGDGGEEGFVVRYNGAGEPQWAEVLGGPGDDRVRSVAAASTKVFVAGSYENGMTLDMWWAGNVFERTLSHAFAVGPNPFLLPLDSADGRAHR
ncbi:MAG: hypothetical protein Tsb0020_01570 [Haliangiales bacterium]